MTALLIDAGNSRIKWARADGGRVGPVRAARYTSWRAADYFRRMFGARPRAARVLIASVAGPEVRRALTGAARRAGLEPRFVRVPRRAGGVTVGYADPWRLGVDRFVAAVGAHHLFPEVAVCVVGVGTAMTVDLIEATGRHRGGMIVPSPALMVETLLSRTHGIRRRASGGRASGGRASGRASGAALFGRSTREAIELGSRYAAAALIDRAVAEARPLVGRRPLVVLTGGAAPTVRPLLQSLHVGVPDLVLRGLAVLAQGPVQRP